MNLRNRWTMGLLSLGAAAILGVSASAVYAQTATPEPGAIAGPQRPERGLALKDNHTALLAEALGITEEELQTAITTARNAAIDQAVTDGRITQEQADELKSREGGPGIGKEGSKEALAAALGITVEELETAQQTVRAQMIAEEVAAGNITQEEADLMTAREAVHGYLEERLQSAYEEAVAQAVADGAITQEQADLLLSQEAGRGFGGPGMHGGPRGGHMGGEGVGPQGGERPEGGPDGEDRGGRGPGQQPEGTPESSSAPVVPSNNTSL